MKLFKSKEKATCCVKGDALASPTQTIDATNAILVLGTGCQKCETLERNVKHALVDLGLDLAVEHITDFAQIASYGVMSTPALVYQGKVVAYGKVLSMDEIKVILSKESN